jgi:hypothetical protein
MNGQVDGVNEDGPDGFGRRGLYRLDSNQSSSSVFEDVEMAHDEVRRPTCAPALC